SVIVLAVERRRGSSSELKSLGVAQGMSPSQYEGSPVLGVAPPTILATSASGTLRSSIARCCMSALIATSPPVPQYPPECPFPTPASVRGSPRAGRRRLPRVG